MASEQPTPAPDPTEKLPVEQRLANLRAFTQEVQRYVRDDLSDPHPSQRRMTMGLAARFARSLDEAGKLHLEKHEQQCPRPAGICYANEDILRVPLNVPAIRALGAMFEALAAGETFDATHPALADFVREFVVHSQMA